VKDPLKDPLWSERIEARDVLIVASVFVGIEMGWTKGATARDVGGLPTSPKNKDGRSWSMLGSIYYAGTLLEASSGAVVLAWMEVASLTLAPAIFDEKLLSTWNDAPERALSEVVGALRRSAGVLL
jgi:hypothetical protein